MQLILRDTNQMIFLATSNTDLMTPGPKEIVIHDEITIFQAVTPSGHFVYLLYFSTLWQTMTRKSTKKP
jgi:hydroxyethylthiazole kinase-like sugar kinase family protein